MRKRLFTKEKVYLVVDALIEYVSIIALILVEKCFSSDFLFLKLGVTVARLCIRNNVIGGDALIMNLSRCIKSTETGNSRAPS